MGGTYWDNETSTFKYSLGVARMIYTFKVRLILCSTFLGVMFVFAIAFFWLTNKEKKKAKLFQLQCICVTLAVLYNASEVGLVAYRLTSFSYFSNQIIHPKLYWTWVGFGHFGEHAIPILADSALLFRISSFFPYPVYAKRTRLLIFLPFWFLLVCRAIAIILIMIFIIAQRLINIQPTPEDPLPWWESPLWVDLGYFDVITLELSLGTFYCILASSILLYKAYQLARSRISMNNKAKIKARMQFLFEALLMCCIPPIVLNIAAPIQAMTIHPHYSYFREIETLYVNLSVIFSILATSWSSIRANWSENKQDVKSNHPKAKNSEIIVNIEGNTM